MFATQAQLVREVTTPSANHKEAVAYLRQTFAQFQRTNDESEKLILVFGFQQRLQEAERHYEQIKKRLEMEMAFVQKLVDAKAWVCKLDAPVRLVQACAFAAPDRIQPCWRAG